MRRVSRLWARAVTLALIIILGVSFSACGWFRRGGKPTVPGAPQQMTAVALDSKVELSWTAAENGGADITKYEITYSPSQDTGSEDVWKSTMSNTAHFVSGLTNGTEYTFKVRAVNSVGKGAEAVATAIPQVDASSAPKITDAHKKIVNDSLAALNSTPKFSARVKVWQPEVSSSTTNEREYIKESGLDKFTAGISTNDYAASTSLSAHILRAEDGGWYRVTPKTGSGFDVTMLGDRAEAESAFASEAAEVFSFLGLISRLGDFTSVLQEDGDNQSLVLYYEKTTTTKKTVENYQLDFVSGIINKILYTGKVSARPSGAVESNQRITVEFDYGAAAIVPPENWQSGLLGDDGAAISLAQLIMAINRAIIESDTWSNSTDALVFELKTYLSYAKYFHTEGGGRFVVDAARLDESAVITELWDVFVVGNTYALTGIDLNSPEFFEQLANSTILESVFPGAGDKLGLLKFLPPAEARALFLVIVEAQIQAQTGRTLDEDGKRTIILAELNNSYFQVNFGRLVEYAIRGGLKVVVPNYSFEPGKEPSGTLTAAERKAMNDALSLLEKASPLRIDSNYYEYDEDELINSGSRVLARTGTGDNFRSFKTIGTIHNYKLRAGNGIFYNLVFQNDKLMSHSVIPDSSEAETSFNSELGGLLGGLSGAERFDELTETLEEIIAGGKALYIFNFEGKNTYNDGTEVVITRTLTVVDGVVTLFEERESILLVGGEYSYVINRHVFSHDGITIEPPAGWESEIDVGGAVTTMGELSVSIDLTLSADSNLSDANKFTLKGYKNKLRYFYYNSNNERFEFGPYALDEPSALAELWDWYLVDQFYAMTGVDLNSSGLYNQLKDVPLVSDRLPTSPFPGFVFPDSLVRRGVIEFIESMYGITNDTQRRAHLTSVLAEVYITAEDLLVTEFVSLGEILVNIVYFD